MILNNDTLRYIQERSSIRAYKDQKLTVETVEALKSAVLAAPTARDRQLLRYFFVQNPELINKIDQRVLYHGDAAMRESMNARGSDSFFYGAPLAVIIVAKENAWADLDAGIAVQTLAIAAQSMGLSSVILGMPRLAFQAEDPDSCRKLLGIEADERFCIAIAIGYGATTKPPHTHKPDRVLDF